MNTIQESRAKKIKVERRLCKVTCHKINKNEAVPDYFSTQMSEVCLSVWVSSNTTINTVLVSMCSFIIQSVRALKSAKKSEVQRESSRQLKRYSLYEICLLKDSFDKCCCPMTLRQVFQSPKAQKGKGQITSGAFIYMNPFT